MRLPDSHRPGPHPLRTGLGGHDLGRVEQLSIDFRARKRRERPFWRFVRDHPLYCFGLVLLVMAAFMIVAIVRESGLDRAILGGTRWRW